MEIITKYNLGDTVYPISINGYQEFVPCPLCEGKGSLKIVGKDKPLMCPDCWGRCGSNKYRQDFWYVNKEYVSKIGNIRLSLFKNSNKNERICMIESTGIGSGTLWKEDDLFPTLEKAQDECDNRNNLKTIEA